jgi:hypothetical protein
MYIYNMYMYISYSQYFFQILPGNLLCEVTAAATFQNLCPLEAEGALAVSVRTPDLFTISEKSVP